MNRPQHQRRPRTWNPAPAKPNLIAGIESADLTAEQWPLDPLAIAAGQRLTQLRMEVPRLLRSTGGQACGPFGALVCAQLGGRTGQHVRQAAALVLGEVCLDEVGPAS